MGAAIPGVLLVTYCIQHFYLRTSRQMRILDLEAKAPLYEHFSETQDGLITIRAFGRQPAFRMRLFELLDKSQRPFYLLYCIQSWLRLTLNLLTAAMAILLVALATQLRHTTSDSVFAVALTNIIGLGETIAGLIQSWTDLETSLGSVARVKRIADANLREDCGRLHESAPDDWPQVGSLVLQDVSASYRFDIIVESRKQRLTLRRSTRERKFPVLKNINIDVPSGTKVGICGRSGRFG